VDAKRNTAGAYSSRAQSGHPIHGCHVITVRDLATIFAFDRCLWNWRKPLPLAVSSLVSTTALSLLVHHLSLRRPNTLPVGRYSSGNLGAMLAKLSQSWPATWPSSMGTITIVEVPPKKLLNRRSRERKVEGNAKLKSVPSKSPNDWPKIYHFRRNRLGPGLAESGGIAASCMRASLDLSAPRFLPCDAQFAQSESHVGPFL